MNGNPNAHKSPHTGQSDPGNQSFNVTNGRDADEDLSVCRIGPWNSKEEFECVYQFLFGPSATFESRRQACDYMRVWKVRRQYLTPASILSTLTILEVHLQDDTEATNAAGDAARAAERQLAMRQLYAHAFTRFLNYMSSILQTRKMRTMYSTASELGLDSFLVDLRHLCAHGHDLPALDVFQRATVYLLDWLHQFYWRRELEHIRDAQARDVRTRKSVEFEEYAAALLLVYDVACEAIQRRCQTLSDLRGAFDDEQQTWSLRKYATYHKLDRLIVVVNRVIGELTDLTARESRVRGNDTVFCTVLFRCRFLMESAAAVTAKTTEKNERRRNEVIVQHQNLFRTLAICGFIETAFRTLIGICEDEHETDVRRRAAQFWAGQIVGGFRLFKDVKRAFKKRKERNDEFEMDLERMNTGDMTRDIREVCKRLGVNCGGVLIFGDTLQRPWSLVLTRTFLKERASTVNAYTRDILDNCLDLVEPALSDGDREILRRLIALGTAEVAVTMDDESTEDDEDGTVYAVDEQLEMLRTLEELKQKRTEEAETASVDVEDLCTYGVWSEVSDGHNWKTVPLGRVPWE